MDDEVKVSEIEDYLNGLSDSDQYYIYNEYLESVGYDDDRLYDMGDLDEILSGQSPSEIANLIYYGEFNPNDNYFKFNGYGNLESLDYVDDGADFNEIAKYCVDNDEDFGESDIRDILDSYEEEEEEEEESEEDDL